MLYVQVNCRIGSLEILRSKRQQIVLVNCRIGSLEILQNNLSQEVRVNCRIGSLETENRFIGSASGLTAA